MSTAMPIVVNPGADELACNNAVFSGISRHHHVKPMAGTASLKWVAQGAATWQTPEGKYTVTPDTCLFLQSGQTYGMQIDSALPVETFCVFFKPGYLEALVSEDVCEQPHRRIEPPERLERVEPKAQIALARLKGAITARDTIAQELALESLGCTLIHQLLGVPPLASRLDLARVASREEIARRLSVARDYGLSNIGEDHSIASLASVACLSTYHFHRLFKQAFGETVGDFLVTNKLVRAARLLRDTELPIWQVSMDCGYQSPTRFSATFKAKYGLSPAEFRKTG